MCFVVADIYVAHGSVMLDFQQGIVRHQLGDDSMTKYDGGGDDALSYFTIGKLYTTGDLIV